MSAYQRRRVVAVWVISIIMAIVLAIAMINTKVAVGPTTSWSGVVTQGPEASATVLALVPIVVAMLWTVLAWFRGSFDTTTSSTKNIDAPLPYKMALLLEMLDDDEREALKQDLRRQILADENNSEVFSRLMVEEAEKRKRG